MRADQAHQHQSGLRAVLTPAEKLRNLLTYGHDDERTGEHQYGLLEYYPIVVAWTTVRSVGDGGGGGGKHAPLPFNADAMDFLAGRYWTNTEVTMAGAGAAGEADPENYREGFEPTVLGLELAVRRQLGLNPAPRMRAEPLQPKPAVVAALRWLGSATETMCAAVPFLADTVREEALRLVVRSRAMAMGSRFDAQKSQCPHCYQPESVWADDRHAVCITPVCRHEDGSRRCWTAVEGAWVSTQEPDLRGRGQVSDEKLMRWAETG